MAHARCTRGEETFRGRRRLVGSDELHFFFFFFFFIFRCTICMRLKGRMPEHNRTRETMRRLFHARDETAGISAVTPCSLYHAERNPRCIALYVIDVQFELSNDSFSCDKAPFGFDEAKRQTTLSAIKDNSYGKYKPLNRMISLVSAH